jgi:hypothetical protein
VLSVDWRKPLSESCFFVVNFGLSSSSLVRGKGDLDPLVSKVKRCFQSWGWQKSPPWHPRILAVSRTLVWIDDISWFPVLVAIAQLSGWGGREPSQLEHIAFTALWTWQKLASNWSDQSLYNTAVQCEISVKIVVSRFLEF